MLAGSLELQQSCSACATAGHSVQQQSTAATELCSGFAYQLGLFQEHQVSVDITDHQDVPQASVQSHLAAFASGRPGLNQTNDRFAQPACWHKALLVCECFL